LWNVIDFPQKNRRIFLHNSVSGSKELWVSNG
jgi:hypothetical protein